MYSVDFVVLGPPFGFVEGALVLGLALGVLSLRLAKHRLELLIEVKCLHVHQAESLSVLNSYVFARIDAVEVVDQVQQLLVELFAVVVRDYWDPVVELVPKTVDGVVDYDKVLKFSVLNDPQILDVDSLGGLYAVIAVESELDEFLCFLLLLDDLEPIRRAIDEVFFLLGEIGHLAELGL